MTPARDILPGVIARIHKHKAVLDCLRIYERGTRWARLAVLATDEETHEARAAFVRGYRAALQKRLTTLLEVEP